jgi:hypothetical protein
VVSTLALLECLLLALCVEPTLRPWGVPVAAIAVALPYWSLFLWFSPLVGTVIGGVLAGLVAAAAYAAPMLNNGGAIVYLYLALAGVAAGALQAAGHVWAERFTPNFRVFEFFVTAPFFCVLSAFFRLGYRPALQEGIAQLSTQWRTVALN